MSSFFIGVACIEFISSFIYICAADDKWFSRAALGVFCVGIYGVINAIKGEEK